VWNHNTHYHDLLLGQVPKTPGCRALDVGCGLGEFASRLAGRATHVNAIDTDASAVAHAATTHASANLHFVAADFMQLQLPDASYDFISAVASLHHMDTAAALSKMKSLLRPNGVLAILGLYRDSTITDYLLGAASFPISKVTRLLALRGDEPARPVRICDPQMSFPEIQRIAATVLPRAEIRRRLFWRYTLFWRKPEAR
jgi:ubiquinone/menaquinone biosynthesis C-methylase UbiE